MDTENNAKRALLAFAVESTLLRMGKPVYEKVTSKLEKDYNCYIPDCQENPEFLKRVLQDIFGDAYDDIINEIRTELGEFISQKYFDDFIKTLAR
ncbi:hypothetical protein [Candidatus Nitrosotenuis sp. DW1]|uniref:hypothetical protein n=1 Tax=Candidatus Nitrosotenuis sp. DW1 TaxID=2259672 RepID=UPI0015CEBB6A|nr:hypothetical protein [Candidatus Nitrosotenuis sp. DW1]QLH08513.1 hypothetical protein DSQ19_02585 [Candidatus Nitrosotenuis sp. DW1]